MRYVSLSGDDREGQVVAGGPVHNSIWVQDTEDGSFHVVTGNPIPISKDPAKQKPHGGSYVEKEYTPSHPPGDFPRTAVSMAEDILYRDWRCMIRTDPYWRKVTGKPEDDLLVAPTDAERAAAEIVMDAHRHRMAFDRYNREEHHDARAPLAEAKLLKLLRENTLCPSDD